jgi:hypothetical protein
MKLKIGAPCPMDWNQLSGDERVRHCERCRLNVYNIADLSPEAVRDLVARTEGRLCVTLYVREERTAAVRECGWARQRRWIRRAVTAGLVLLLAGVGTALPRSSGGQRPPSRLVAWITRQMEELGLISRPLRLVGEMPLPRGIPLGGLPD